MILRYQKSFQLSPQNILEFHCTVSVFSKHLTIIVDDYIKALDIITYTSLPRTVCKTKFAVCIVYCTESYIKPWQKPYKFVEKIF